MADPRDTSVEPRLGDSGLFPWVVRIDGFSVYLTTAELVTLIEQGVRALGASR